MNASSDWSIEYLMGRWQPGIGDPSFMGWFTAISYVLCAVMALSMYGFNRITDRQASSFWLTIGCLMLMLGVNKQLDLQSLFTEMGRQVARAQGWMENRRMVQFWFILLFGSIFLCVFAWFTAVFRHLYRRFLLAFTGLFLLLSYIIVRAASFHHFDEIIQFRFSGIKLNWIFELTGIYLVILGAFKDLILGIRRGE